MQSDTLEFVGESDDKDTVLDAFYPDMWLARYGGFLRDPISVTYKQSDTALFIALFAMAVKTSSVIDEYRSSMNVKTTNTAVYGAIDQFCYNEFNKTLVEELKDGDIIKLTELIEGKGDVSHIR